MYPLLSAYLYLSTRSICLSWLPMNNYLEINFCYEKIFENNSVIKNLTSLLDIHITMLEVFNLITKTVES